MARSRNIKPGFFTNDVLAELAPLTRLLFAGLWTLCDRDGRCEDRPKRIKGQVLAYDNCDADGMLQELAEAGFIARYKSKGQAVIQVLAWDKHQNPHCKEVASTLPPMCEADTDPEPTPDKHGASTVQEQCDASPLPERAGLIPDSFNLIPDSLINTSSARKRPACVGEGEFPRFWALYPNNGRRTNRKKCLEKWLRNRLDDIADEICAHVEALKQTRKWADGYEPAALSYLNGEHWNDGVPDEQAQRPQLSAYQQHQHDLVARATGSSTHQARPRDISAEVYEINALRIKG